MEARLVTAGELALEHRRHAQVPSLPLA